MSQVILCKTLFYKQITHVKFKTKIVYAIQDKSEHFQTPQNFTLPLHFLTYEEQIPSSTAHQHLHLVFGY